MKTRLLILSGGLLVFGLVNGRIVSKERLRATGEPVYLELAPVDPRSLMQGDYMALNFHLTRELAALPSPSRHTAILQLDDRRIGHLAGLDTGRPLNPGEQRLQYRYRSQNIWLGTNAFFFQEGQSERYRTARYGEFRVNPAGDAILINLRGPNLEPL